MCDSVMAIKLKWNCEQIINTQQIILRKDVNMILVYIGRNHLLCIKVYVVIKLSMLLRDVVIIYLSYMLSNQINKFPTVQRIWLLPALLIPPICFFEVYAAFSYNKCLLTIIFFKYMASCNACRIICIGN